jgi:hypothetical protein
MSEAEYLKRRLFHSETALRTLMGMLLDSAPHLERPICNLGNAWDAALDQLQGDFDGAQVAAQQNGESNAAK